MLDQRGRNWFGILMPLPSCNQEVGRKRFQRISVSYEIIYGKALCKLYICVGTAVFSNHSIQTVNNNDTRAADIF